MEICSFGSPANLQSPCWKKTKSYEAALKMERVYSFSILVASTSNWPGFLNLGMSTPGLGVGRASEGSWPEEFQVFCVTRCRQAWFRTKVVKLRNFSENRNGDPLLLGLSKCQGPWGPVTIMLCLLLATDVARLLLLLGGNCFFLSLKTQTEKGTKQRGHERRREEGG